MLLHDTIAESVSALGKNVMHRFYSIGQYADIFNEYNQEKIREIFHDLSNEDNYPIYIHCTYGRDRTGTVVYLLGALLGMSDGDLQIDYELSAFSYSTVNKDEFQHFKNEIRKLNGDTTQQKIEGYLLSIGVSSEEIAQIREIFLGD